VAGFREKLWRNQGYYGDFLTDLPLQCLWDSMPFQPGPAGALTFFFGGRAGFELIEGFDPNMAMLNDLEPVFPGLSKAYNGRHTLWNLADLGPFPVAAILAINPASRLPLSTFDLHLFP